MVLSAMIDWVRGGRFQHLARRIAFANYASWLPLFAQRWLIARSPLVDESWLAATGIRGDRSTIANLLTSDMLSTVSPLLDLNWYRARYGLRGTAAEVLLHYVWVGDRIGLRPHPWFDAGSARQSAKGGVGLLATVLARYMADWRTVEIPHPLFDQNYYLRTNEDVRASGSSPLLHFVMYGLKEGRNPNEYFDSLWYARNNADVALAGIHPAMHFVMYGAAEGRSPGPDFDAIGYRLQVGEALGFLDPLSHYLTIGRQQGIRPVRRCIRAIELLDTPGVADAIHAPVVDVVIPVYRGLHETRACIESALAAANLNGYRLHIYNDHSPEPEITEYLRHVAASVPQVRLVENEVNRGFVGTVNRAMDALMGRQDFDSVILLNSDTEVTGDWAIRLRSHASRNRDVATVTAMSNNATICSYPHFGENPVPSGELPAEIDSVAAAVNRGRSVEIPTGVGFCMLITRTSLERVGLFDESAFGKGYGEEVDFCQRAVRAGMLNLLALDVYVKHAGEVSFSTSSKPGKLVGENIVRSRYPDYASNVSTFVGKDPGQYARLRLTFGRWRRRARDVHVLFTHALGGGTERRVQETVSALPNEARAVVIRPTRSRLGEMLLECTHPEDGFSASVELTSADDLAALLDVIGARRIEIHHVMGFSNFLRRGIAISGIPFDFVVHDYYSVCPQVTLTDAGGDYCGELGPSQCDQCISERPSHGARDIRNWRIENEWLVLGASELTAPSQDCARRIRHYFGRTPVVLLHEQIRRDPVLSPPPLRRGMKRRVIVLGALAPHKGRRLVLAAAEEALQRSLPLEFHLIGDPNGEIPKRLRPVFTSTGRYQEAQLKDKIREARGDVFLFASQAPETYSYTLTAAIESGLPVVATRLGSFVERLSGLPRSHLVNPDIAPAELAEVLLAVSNSTDGMAA